MKLTDNIRRILSALLVFALFFSLAPVDAFAAGEDAVVVISGSDYQQKGTAPQSTTTSILNQIKKDYTTADGFLFGGDYYQDTLDTTTKSKEGKNELDAAVSTAFPTLANRVYIQGNHDNDSLVSDGTLSATGAHDTAHYGVYAINEKDYPWGWQASSSFQSTCKNTANNLDAYLDAKADAGYTLPIFVITHVPLHFSPRTSSMGDGKYAKYLYDVLDEAGDKGLNIIFLFGHNHSNTYDDYIGGGQIYLAKGSTIAIANEGSTTYFTDELSFTYMNCGYVGYIGGKAGTNLSLSVFEIRDDEVIVKRYGTNGQVQLKAAGVTTSGAPAADTSVVESGATISIGTPVPPVTVTDNNVTVTSAGLTGLSVTKVFGTDSTGSYDSETYSAYASYDITPEGYTQGKSATVTIQLDTADGFDASRAVLVIDQQSGTEKRLNIENGAVTFTTNHFSTYDVAQRDPNAGYNYELATSIKAGESYVIVGNSHAVALMDSNGSLGSQNVEISGNTLTSETELTEWTISATSKGTVTSSDGRKLGYSSSSWNLTGSGDCTFDIGTGSGNFSFRVVRSNSGYNRYYFNYDGSSWTSKPTSAAYVRLYQLITEDPGTTEPSEPTTPSEPSEPTDPTEPSEPDEGGQWTELPAGNTYTLDTDGIDSGAKYLIVAESYAKALTAASSNSNASDVTISGNNATADAAYGWTFTSSGSGYTIQKNGSYLGRSSSSIAAGSASSVWTVSSQGSGKYNVTQSGSGSSWWGGSSTYYVRWSNSNGYFQASSSNKNPVRLYKYTGSGSSLNANYIRLAGETEQNYVIADAADLNTVLGKIRIETSNDGKTVSGETAVTSGMVTWDKTFNGAAAGTYTGTVSCENKTLGTVTVTVIAQHNFETVTVEPTCTVDGSITTKCTICGEQTVEVIKASGHDYKCVETAATCGKDGSKVYTCDKCSDTYSEVIKATGDHKFETVTVNATCTKAGSVTTTCSVCGEKTVEEIAALGHDYKCVETAPTCAAAGSKVYTCANCADSYTETIPATGNHKYVSVTLEPTCTETGSVTYTCETCGDSYAEVIAALGHSYESTVTAATCTENGYTTYTCTVCADSYRGEEIAAFGHTYDSKVTATCTQDGFVVYTCTTCGHSYNGESVAAYGHSYESTTVAPTCATAGYTTYVCTACGYTYTGNEVAALGHSYNAVVTAATCTEAGYTTYTCTVCDHSYVGDNVAALGHDYESVVTAPTYEAEGYTTHTCKVCGDVTVDSFVPMLRHTYETVTIDATCTTEGAVVHTCVDCGYSYTEVLPALGHITETVTTDATCTDNGSIVTVCTVCGETETEILPATGHSFETITIAPTCTEAGYTTHTCPCGHVITEETAALGHSYTAKTVDPTCTENGGTTYTCAVCGHSYTDVIAALGHSYVSESVAPTCTAAGYTVYICQTCGHSYNGDEVAALGHSYESIVTAPTCTETGYTTHTCTVCGHSYTDGSTAALGHSYTVQEENNKRVYTCTVCGYSYSESLALTYTKVSSISGNNNYVITFTSGNKHYAMSHKNNQISAVQVTVSNNQITSEISADLIWTYDGSKLSYKSGNTTYYLHAQPAGGWWGWWSAPTLTVSSANSTAISFSNNQVKMSNYYLRYSNSKISLNSRSSTTSFFIEK